MSDSTVIQPAPGQAILTTDSSNHHRDHGHHGEGRHFDAVEARADFRSLTNEVERFGTINGDRTMSGVQVTGDRINTVGAAGALASGNTDRLVQTGLAGVHDRLCDAKAGIVHAVQTAATAGALASCKTDDGVQLVGKDAVTLAKDNLIAMNVGFSAINTQNAAIGSAAQVLATAFAGQARDQATMYADAQTVQAQAIAAAGTVQLERVRAELALAQTTGFAAQVLLATQLDAQARREAAKCCCDTEKMLLEKFAALEASMIREGSAGRELQRDIYTRQLERVLASIPRTPGTVPVGA